MKVSIHQPNFFPYFPFFQKVQQSDLFVILGNCQFEKNNYQNRFQFNKQWFTMSVNSGLQPIADKRYVNHIYDWEKLKRSFPNHDLSIFDKCISDNLLQTNTRIIKKACELLGIKTKIVGDFPTKLYGTARLVDICKYYGATKYLSGISGKKYLELSLFEKAGIEVVFQNESSMNRKALIEIL